MSEEQAEPVEEPAPAPEPVKKDKGARPRFERREKGGKPRYPNKEHPEG
jgi:hypothetical protein